MSSIKEDDEHVIHGPAPKEPLRRISLGKLIYESLLKNPNRNAAFVDAVTGNSISFREILGKSCSLAESLRRAGYGNTSIFSICSANNLEFFIPIISTFYIGATMCPINHNYTEGELAHTINICKPKLIFCSKEVSEKYLRLKQTKLNFIERIIIIDSEEAVPGAETMTDFIKKHLNSSELIYEVNIENINPDEHVALVMCSSGTTGLPKGVMQTHTNLMSRYMHTIDPRYSRKEKSLCGVLPFFHGYGLTTTFFSMVEMVEVIVIKRFEERVFLRAIEKYRISILYIAPPLVVFLAKSPLVSEYDLSSIREVVSGAAPLSKDTEEAAKKRLMIPTVRQGYGLTESTLGVIVMEIGHAKFGSSGHVVSYMSCKVRDPETGKSLGPNQVGELCFKGPMVMKGYFGNEESTKNSFTSDGWLLSGDLGYYDEEKYFFIVDRLKELIKYNGFQVAPAELEALLLSHPKIQDVGVVGLPDERAGELPLAFVVKSLNAKLSEKEVEDFVSGKVSAQKRLRGGVIFVNAIPKNPSGKILRRELRQLLQTYKAKL